MFRVLQLGFDFENALISEKSQKENAKDKTSVNKTSSTSNFKADAKATSGNDSKTPDEWSTSPADTILFPETYLSTIKRVLENTSLQSNSSQPITKNGLGKQVPEESKHGKASLLQNDDDEEEVQDARRLKQEKDKVSAKNMTGEI